MPVRSLNSSVITWPDAATVTRAFRQWAEETACLRPELRRVGYFGSLARGNWGVGSDIDAIILVSAAATPFFRRAAEWDLTRLPVPADVLVFTEEEWRAMRDAGRRMSREPIEWIFVAAG